MSEDVSVLSECFHKLDATVQQQTRFSKHGKYFTPFSQCLRPKSTGTEADMYPMAMAVPFLDWSILGSKPPLRFQVDRREGFRSARSSVHLLRSLLQYFYRLEDTLDRESSQVFAKHKPWSTYPRRGNVVNAQAKFPFLDKHKSRIGPQSTTMVWSLSHLPQRGRALGKNPRGATLPAV